MQQAEHKSEPSKIELAGLREAAKEIQALRSAIEDKLGVRIREAQATVQTHGEQVHDAGRYVLGGCSALAMGLVLSAIIIAIGWKRES